MAHDVGKINRHVCVLCCFVVVAAAATDAAASEVDALWNGRERERESEKNKDDNDDNTITYVYARLFQRVENCLFILRFLVRVADVNVDGGASPKSCFAY